MDSDIPSQIIFQQVHNEYVATDVICTNKISNTYQDSIIERKGKSTDIDEKKEKSKQDSEGCLPNNRIPNYLTTAKRNKNWMLSISYSGVTHQTDFQKIIIPSSITSGEPKEILEESHHCAPIVFSLSAQKKINAHWGLETGIQYTLLRSEFASSDDTRLERAQKFII